VLTVAPTVESYAFTTMGGWARCSYDAYFAAASLRCDLGEYRGDPEPPVKGCVGKDAPHRVSLGIEGKGSLFCPTDAVDSEHARALPRGATLVADPFTCTSRKDSLRCVNSQGHGFEVNAYYRDLF